MNGWFHRLHGSQTQRFRCNFWVGKLENDGLLEAVVRKKMPVKIEWVSNVADGTQLKELAECR